MYTPSCALSLFLRNHRHNKESKNNWTNTKFPDKKIPRSGGTYRIANRDYNKFLKIYSQDIDNNCKCNNKRLTEKFSESAPLVVDLDLRLETRPNKSVFDSQSLIKEIVQIHVNYLKDHFDTSLIRCVVQKCKDNPVFDPRSNRYKDGIHLIFVSIRSWIKYWIIFTFLNYTSN
jgi:hypothetical protein